MKIKMKTLLISAAVMLAGLPALAGGINPTVKFKILNNRSFALYINNINDTEIQISIKDKNGISLLNEKLKNEDLFAKKFNFSRLVEGEYFVEIQDELTTRSFPVVLEANKLDVLEDKMYTTYSPILRQNEKQVDIMVFSPHKAKHELTIYNNKNEIVHDETIVEEANIQKKFDFSVAARGNYSLVINSEGRHYTYRIPVN